jgi:hypothetical protein
MTFDIGDAGNGPGRSSRRVEIRPGMDAAAQDHATVLGLDLDVAHIRQRSGCLGCSIQSLGLAALVDQVTSSVICLAMHNVSRGAYMLQRQLVEYVVRAFYFDHFPEEATFQTFRIAKEQLTMLRFRKVPETDPEYIKAKSFYEESSGKYPAIATETAAEKSGRNDVGALRWIL